MANRRIGGEMSNPVYKELWYVVRARRGGWFIVWDESGKEAKINSSYRDVSGAISKAQMLAEWDRERGE